MWKSLQNFCILTCLSLVSFLWDIGKQYSPRCDAAQRGVPSRAILFEKFHRKIEYKIEITPVVLQYESGLTQMLMMGQVHSSYEPHREKTGFLPRRKQRRRSASQ